MQRANTPTFTVPQTPQTIEPVTGGLSSKAGARRNERDRDVYNFYNLPGMQWFRPAHASDADKL
jgi:hypothetical protein